MKLSTRSRYGLRALVELAGHHGEGPLNMRDIAAQQNISHKYLDAVFNALKVAGLAISRRGPGGGWQLTRAPETIRLSEVIPALEGSLGFVPCVDFPDTCVRHEICPTREVYEAMHEAVIGALDRFSLADLYRRKIDLEALISHDGEGADLCSPDA